MTDKVLSDTRRKYWKERVDACPTVSSCMGLPSRTWRLVAQLLARW